MSSYVIGMLSVTGINVILALSLNMIAGYCGQVSLGHAAFYGIGAYTAALLLVAGMSLLPALLLGALLAGAVGVIVGLTSLRVRHDFLAITTMAVGFLFIGLVRKLSFVGGELGIGGIPASGFGEGGDAFLVLIAALATAALSFYLGRNWTGFAFQAVASDELAARTIGINVSAYKLVAFGIGTALAGLAGGLYTNFVRFIAPETFGFGVSVLALCMVVVGGIGSTVGVISGAILLTIFPEVLRFTGNFRLLMYGALLIAVMLFSPGGLAGLARSTARLVGSRS
jgi:branched-chain amino acid transport system permease protein